MNLTITEAFNVLVSEGFNRDDVYSVLSQLVDVGLYASQVDGVDMVNPADLHIAREQLSTPATDE